MSVVSAELPGARTISACPGVIFKVAMQSGAPTTFPVSFAVISDSEASIPALNKKKANNMKYALPLAVIFISNIVYSSAFKSFDWTEMLLTAVALNEL